MATSLILFLDKDNENQKKTKKKWSHYCLEQKIIPEPNGLTILVVKTSLEGAVPLLQL